MLKNHNVYIQTHNFPDPDAIASAFGLQQFLVHAAGQTANVRLTVDLTVREIKEYVNQYLPEDIGILEIEEVSEKFHARLSAVKKTYCYRIFNSTSQSDFHQSSCDDAHHMV